VHWPTRADDRSGSFASIPRCPSQSFHARVLSPVRAGARARVMGFTPTELFPPPALSCRYPRTPRLRPRARRAAAVKLASVFSAFNGHAARLTLPRASATSRPPLPAKCHGVLLANLVLEPCLAGRLGRAIASDNEHYRDSSFWPTVCPRAKGTLAATRC
jgi:hypothetical protein